MDGTTRDESPNITGTKHSGFRSLSKITAATHYTTSSYSLADRPAGQAIDRIGVMGNATDKEHSTCA